ncbi:lytic transglycosylase domain-containing protein [Pseudomonas aeruginosa]|nr:lytic transglycosylase domain-containing protein [Pseudomonas aeruginosa]
MVATESAHDHEAVSHQGAIGLMQVVQDTGKRFGFHDIQTPHDNLRAGATYIKWLLNHFEHDLELALEGYNAGKGAVAKYGRAIPPYPETKKYIAKVMKLYIESQPNIRETTPQPQLKRSQFQPQKA